MLLIMMIMMRTMRSVRLLLVVHNGRCCDAYRMYCGAKSKLSHRAEHTIWMEHERIRWNMNRFKFVSMKAFSDADNDSDDNLSSSLDGRECVCVLNAICGRQIESDKEMRRKETEWESGRRNASDVTCTTLGIKKFDRRRIRCVCLCELFGGLGQATLARWLCVPFKM